MTSKNKNKCLECGKVLRKEEFALSCKLIGDTADEMYCVPCLAEYIGCSEIDLKVKIQEFKEQGCALFL